MKHGISLRKLGRPSKHRKAMLRTLVSQLITHGKIITTVPRAKELRRVAEKLITKVKTAKSDPRPQLNSYVRTPDCSRKLVEEYAPRYADRAGGYTRTTRLGRRLGDNAEICAIEYIKESVEESRKKKDFEMFLKQERSAFKRDFIRRSRAEPV